MTTKRGTAKNKTAAKDVHKEMQSDHRDARRDGDHRDEKEKPRERCRASNKNKETKQTLQLDATFQ